VVYGLNLLLGIAVQFRWISTRRRRWVHHALYAVVFALALAAAALAWAGERAERWPLLGVILILSVFPLARGRTCPHALLGLAGATAYALAFALAA
jgi:hypothetical protein